MEFFDRDVEKVNAWATSIQILDFKLRHNEEFMDKNVRLREINREENDEENSYLDDVIRNEEIERNQALFNELVSVAAKIKELFVPLGRPGRVPKLFADLWLNILKTIYLFIK